MARIDYELHPIDALENPLFIMAFKGLFDMGEAATAAVDWLSMTHGGKPGASIDPELLFDFQEVRPQIRLGVGGQREILWPSNNVVWAKTPEGSPDLVLLSGVEPNLRWRSFSKTIRELVEITGSEMVITLGASLAMVPHSRRLPVRASTGDEALAERLGVSMPSYEGPTGLVGSLHEHFGEHNIPAMSLSVSVPHYVPGAPSPKATAGLLANLERLCSVPTQHAGLADDIRDWESRIHLALEDDEEVQRYVAELEEQADATPEIVFEPNEPAPSIEDFLRDVSDKGNDGGEA